MAASHRNGTWRSHRRLCHTMRLLTPRRALLMAATLLLVVASSASAEIKRQSVRCGVPKGWVAVARNSQAVVASWRDPSYHPNTLAGPWKACVFSTNRWYDTDLPYNDGFKLVGVVGIAHWDSDASPSSGTTQGGVAWCDFRHDCQDAGPYAGQYVSPYGVEARVHELVLAPDGTLAWIWDLGSNSQVMTLNIHDANYATVATERDAGSVGELSNLRLHVRRHHSTLLTWTHNGTKRSARV
jgi:hypothetical protein